MLFELLVTFVLMLKLVALSSGQMVLFFAERNKSIASITLLRTCTAHFYVINDLLKREHLVAELAWLGSQLAALFVVAKL